MSRRTGSALLCAKITFAVARNTFQQTHFVCVVTLFECALGSRIRCWDPTVMVARRPASSGTSPKLKIPCERVGVIFWTHLFSPPPPKHQIEFDASCNLHPALSVWTRIRDFAVNAESGDVCKHSRNKQPTVLRDARYISTILLSNESSLSLRTKLENICRSQNLLRRVFPGLQLSA